MTQAAAVTFLFTDIEGSTRLWEKHPAVMALALERHDRICRQVVEAHSGRLVKMVGDGLHAAFADPSSAIAGAIDLQRAMSSIAADYALPFRVRCGLHAGVSQMRDGDYFGSEVNRAARIMGAAHGGQVLVSQAVVDGLQHSLPGEADLLPLGRVRLRDLSDPEPLWQLLHSDLEATFPPLRSLDSTPNNLPWQNTSFVGRERDIAEVKELLGTNRLITLVGAGGCGKTRLSLQVAADVLDDFQDGVWVVEYAALFDPLLVPQTLATVLGVKEKQGEALVQTLCADLASKQALLILDNAEHLLDACAHLARKLIRACPSLVMLVSSREPLGVEEERSFRVPSLSTPNPMHHVSPQDIVPFESVRLFVERARLASPRFGITDANAPALASLCQQLDGMPLALELAAARVRSISVEEMDRLLAQRFRLLTGGSRALPRRQQTLRASIDWSFDLLNESEKAVLGSVSVFAGGWTLGAAEQVAPCDGVEAWEVLDLLTSLADKSLLVAEERQDSTRYRLLETVRQYAGEQLSGMRRESRHRESHLAYFTSLAEEAEPQLTGSNQQMWLDRLETEHDNLRAALAWSVAEGGDAETGLRLAGTMWRFWSVRGYLEEGRRSLDGLLERTQGAHSGARARALNVAGLVAQRQGDYQSAERHFGEALAIWRRQGDRSGVARVLNNVASFAIEQGDFTAARPLYDESLAIRRELGDQEGTAIVLNNLAILAQYQGDLAGAMALYQESLAIYRAMNDRLAVATGLSNIGGLHYHEREFDAAQSRFEESLAIRRAAGDRDGIANSLNNLGSVAYERGDLALARRNLEEALATYREIGDRWRIASTLATLGAVICDGGDLVSARRVQEEGLTIRQKLGDRRGIAISLASIATLATRRGDPARAACIWGAAERLREEIGSPDTPNERATHDRQVAAARTAAGEATDFDAAWQRGRAMTLDEAIQHAFEETSPDR